MTTLMNVSDRRRCVNLIRHVHNRFFFNTAIIRRELKAIIIPNGGFCQTQTLNFGKAEFRTKAGQDKQDKFPEAILYILHIDVNTFSFRS